MSGAKKLIRQRFRDACYARDKYRCVTCGFKSNSALAERDLDAHHIVDRNDMPNGGYVKENGISLCVSCHKKAEEFHSTDIAIDGFGPQDLYKKINSSYELAVKASHKLNG